MAQTVKVKDLQVILEQVQAQLAALTERVAQLETSGRALSSVAAMSTPSTPLKPSAAKTAPATPAKQEITEEEILAISAALGAYLGVRVHIRQVRLLSSSAWSQQGRVSVQTHIPYTHTSN